MQMFKHTDHLCPHHVVTIEKSPDIKTGGKILYIERDMGICKITIDKDDIEWGYSRQETIKIPEGSLVERGWYIISWDFKIEKQEDTWNIWKDLIGI